MCNPPIPLRHSRQASSCRTARREFAARQRGGITLIELLVVVAILGILMGLTATVVRPLQEGRDIREASRSVHAYLAAAQAHAMSLQRPVGIWIKRFSNNPNMALELYMAEVPTPYMGDDLSSYAMVRASGLNQATLVNVSRPGTGSGNEPYVNVTKDDFIRFGFKGPLYRVMDYPAYDSETPAMDVVFDREVLYRNGFANLPFQVYRYARPTQSAADPLQLPSSVVLDISVSGSGGSDVFYSRDGGVDVAIMFSPSGGIQYVITGEPGAPPARVSSAVHLLIGRPDNIGRENLMDGNNRWISIGYLTGRMTTSEIALDPNDPGPNGPSINVNYARKFAVQGQTMGGG